MQLLWLVGNRRSDTLRPSKQFFQNRLWLVGNRRSDTLNNRAKRQHRQLWLVGNRRSDTLSDLRIDYLSRCGLWGIAARIHLNRPHCRASLAVACGESPLGYTNSGRMLRLPGAVACGESPLGYTVFENQNRRHVAVACGESPLGYTA